MWLIFADLAGLAAAAVEGKELIYLLHTSTLYNAHYTYYYIMTFIHVCIAHFNKNHWSFYKSLVILVTATRALLLQLYIHEITKVDILLN